MRYFITNVLPHELCGKYKVSIAAANFSWALINSKAFDRTFSIAPSNVIGKIDDVVMPQLVYSSFRKKGKIFAKLAPFFENMKIFKKIRSNSSVWFYNISIINMLLFYMLKLFKPSVKCNVIILDIFIPQSRFSLDNLLLYTINKADATIKLSNSPRFKCENSVCLPGVVPKELPRFPEVVSVGPVFLLSGLLREDISQVSLVIDAFERIPEAELFITGFSDKDTDLRQRCSNISNIHYLGEIPYNDYVELLHQIPFLLSMRDPSEEGNQCNFPSKVIEGILHNRIIVSSMEYDQLKGLKYLKVSSNLEALQTDIRNIINRKDILLFANQARYATESFNPNRWAEIMNDLENRI